MHRAETLGKVGTAAILALVLPLAACDGDEDGTTDPGSQGSVQAVMTDEPGEANASTVSRTRFALDSRTVDGSFEANARVEVSVDGETWIDLGSMESVSVALQTGEDAVIHADASLPAETFARVRLVLENARANVLAGSTIGTDLLDVDVEIAVAGGGEVVIEKTVTLDVSAGSQATVVFDLNSESWLDEGNVQSRTATAAELEASTTVRIQ